MLSLETLATSCSFWILFSTQRSKPRHVHKSTTHPEAQASIFVLGMHNIHQLAQKSRSPEHRDNDRDHAKDLESTESSPHPPAHFELVDAQPGPGLGLEPGLFTPVDEA